jgi:hypothetical protein
MAFDPDLIIVNFISDSILRRLRYAGIPISGLDRKEAIARYVRTNFLERIDWFSRCPELIVATFGRLWGGRCMLPLTGKEFLAADSTFRFSDRAEAVKSSIAAVRDMLSVFPHILFLQMPLFHELENQQDPRHKGLVETLRAAVPEARFMSMRRQMEALLEGKRFQDRPDLKGKTLHQIAALPEAQRLEVYRWFFLPEDVHYTDYGTTLYAREVARVLSRDVAR